MESLLLEDLGEPSLRIEGFRLWVHGLPLPEPVDGHWDRWLRITAHCGATGASVWVEGELLIVGDVMRLCEGCEALHRGEPVSAVLKNFDPSLHVAIERKDRLGHLTVRVEINPDFRQVHTIQFDIDQTFLPTIARDCAAIVRACGGPDPRSIR